MSIKENGGHFGPPSFFCASSLACLCPQAFLRLPVAFADIVDGAQILANQYQFGSDEEANCGHERGSQAWERHIAILKCPNGHVGHEGRQRTAHQAGKDDAEGATEARVCNDAEQFRRAPLRFVTGAHFKPFAICGAFLKIIIQYLIPIVKSYK